MNPSKICTRFCISVFVFLVIIPAYNHFCNALLCPCNIGPCPSLGTNESIVDTCARNYSHTYCVRTLNLTIENGSILKKREIYRCANFSTAKHDVELMIHIPTNSSDQVTIEYRCRNQDHCSLELLQDDDCESAAMTVFGHGLGVDLGAEKGSMITSEEIRNLQPDIQKTTSDSSRTCRCVEMKPVGKVSESQDQHCRWTNDVRRDSGRNLPYCRTDTHHSFAARDDLRASIFCRGIDPSFLEGGRSFLKNVAEEKGNPNLGPRRFRCTMVCNYADKCNREEEFEKLYCAAMRQLKATSKNQPVTVLKRPWKPNAGDSGAPSQGDPSKGHQGGDHNHEDPAPVTLTTTASLHVIQPTGQTAEEKSNEDTDHDLTTPNHDRPGTTKAAVTEKVTPEIVVKTAGHEKSSSAVSIRDGSARFGLISIGFMLVLAWLIA